MRRTAQLLGGIALLAGCGGVPSITDTTADCNPPAFLVASGCAASRTTTESAGGIHPSAVATRAPRTAGNRDLAALRSATARFHRIEVAKAAGYDVQFPPGCFTNDSGGMGFHFLNNSKVGTLTVTGPQLLMYEPQRNGAMRLVGVEYIVPGAPSDAPPSLFGRPFTYNFTFNVWALHVWAWKDNPRGIYANWNPRVTCADATVLATISHH